MKLFFFSKSNNFHINNLFQCALVSCLLRYPRVNFYDVLAYVAVVDHHPSLSHDKTCCFFLLLSLGTLKEPVSTHGQSCWSLVGLMLQILSDVAFFLSLKRRIVDTRTYLFCILYVLCFLSSLVLSSLRLSSDFLINASSAKIRDKGRTSLGRNRQRRSD